MGRYVALGLLGLLLVLLFAPVEVEAVWRRQVLGVRVRLLGIFCIPILPRKAKEDKPSRPAGKRRKKKAAPPAQKEKKGPPRTPLDTLQLVNDLLPHLAESAGYLMKRITLSRCRIALVLSGEEAADVGIACGRAYALGYSLQAGLRGLIRVREFVFNVLPDYISGQDAADVEAALRVRPSSLLAGGILFLWRAGGTLLAQRQGSPPPKGGRKPGTSQKKQTNPTKAV